MELRECHGASEKEIETYSRIVHSDVLSVAYYHLTTGKEKMQPFVHGHEAYEFIIPFDTIPILRYQEANYIGEVGYAYPVNPFVKHGIGFELESELYSVVVDREYMESVKKRLGFQGQWFYTRFFIGRELLVMLNRYINFCDLGYVDKIVEALVRDGLKEKIDNRRPDAEYNSKIKSSLVFMYENYKTAGLTIKNVAKNSGFGYTYFTKAFVKYMHDTPINHLNKLRLSEAKKLMREHSEMTFEEIAVNSGFKSGSAFCEAFKRIIGISPKEYKKNFI